MVYILLLSENKTDGFQASINCIEIYNGCSDRPCYQQIPNRNRQRDQLPIWRYSNQLCAVHVWSIILCSHARQK